MVLVFLYHLTFYPEAMAWIDITFPWKLLSVLLNSLLHSYRDFQDDDSRLHDKRFPRPEKELPRPLPEDFAMRGLLWVEKYFPSDWFCNDKMDDEEKYLEAASMADVRKERVLWLGCRIAKVGRWLTYSDDVDLFGVTTEFEKEVESASTEDIQKNKERYRTQWPKEPSTASGSPSSTYSSVTGQYEMLNLSETDSTSRTATWTLAKEGEDAMDVDIHPVNTDKPVIYQ